MDALVKDYYSGFEGEPEIQFITIMSNGRKFIVMLWYGHFFEIMEKIKPASDGWHSLAYYYNMHEGWYDQSPWQIPNVNEALDQLKTIDTTGFDKETNDVYNDVCALLAQAASEKKPVWIAYD
jgi:ABC-type transport system substrate-binding protein